MSEHMFASNSDGRLVTIATFKGQADPIIAGGADGQTKGASPHHRQVRLRLTFAHVHPVGSKYIPAYPYSYDLTSAPSGAYVVGHVLLSGIQN